MYAKQLSFDDIKEVVRNLKSTDVKVTADGYSVEQAVSQIDNLHCNDDGFITIAVKTEDNWQQYHYNSGELKENIHKVLSLHGINVYVSPNSFYKPFRKIENVRKLNALYIDLDYYTLAKLKDLTPAQIIYLLDDSYFKKEVPEASFIVITGMGIAIYWSIEPVPYKALPLWNAVQKFFLEKLKEVGADPKSIDASRVMRLAGSTNQKNGQAAELLLYNTEYKYGLREIQEEYLPALTPYVKNPGTKKKGRKSKEVKLFTIYSLHHARLMDIVKLQEIREGYCRNGDGSLNKTGQRELLCFLYRYWACCFTNDSEKALEDTLAFNKTFASPLSENEVRSQTGRAEKAYEEWMLNGFNLKKNEKDEISEEDKKKANRVKKDRKRFKLLGYNYKNETLIELLCITEEEMRELRTIIDKKEARRRTNIRTNEIHKSKRRDENGLTKREKLKLEKVKSIEKLKNKGMPYSKIAEELAISINTVKKYVSKYLK